MQGWASIHRKFTDSSLWLSEPFTKGQAWVDLFVNANHTEGSFWIRGNEIRIKRGQIGWSEITMSKRWTWSRNKVRRFLKWLEKEQQIEQQKKHKLTSIITIINYETYQSDTTDDTTEGQQKDNRRYTNNNDNNDNNDNKRVVVEQSSPSQIMKDFLNSFKEKNESYSFLLEHLQEKGIPKESAEIEIAKFISYWTELNKSGTKQRWELEKTFEVRRRLGTWFSNIKGFNKKKKGIVI